MTREVTRGVTKSDVIRSALEQAVALDRISRGEDVLISLADAVRALTGLRQLPHSAQGRGQAGGYHLQV